MLRSEARRFAAAVDEVAALARSVVDRQRPLVVIGHEEFMYLPLCIAERLENAGLDVRYQTTTRSPAHVRDVAGYPLRRGFEFTAPEVDSAAHRYLYNVNGTDELPAQVLLVADSPADTDTLRAPGGLIDVLTAAGHDLTVLVVPASRQATLAAARGER